MQTVLSDFQKNTARSPPKQTILSNPFFSVEGLVPGLSLPRLLSQWTPLVAPIKPSGPSSASPRIPPAGYATA